MQIQDYKNIYFVGIGGVSMSGLALILADSGYIVKGSDTIYSSNIENLIKQNIHVNIGQVSNNITNDIDLIIYTAAVSTENPELMKGRELGIKIIDRAHLLGLLMKNYEFPISIAGTHGKSSTTSMLSEIFLLANKNPTITVGGNLKSIKGNINIGDNKYFIVESCEYFDSFLQFFPHTAAVLNIELDHVDYFNDIGEIRKSFIHFCKNIDISGNLLINKSIEDIKEIINELECNIITYGVYTGDLQAINVKVKDSKTVFEILFKGENLGGIELQVLGKHNVENALAAIGIALCYNIDFNIIKEALKDFTGIGRRFEIKGSINGAKIYDDYAHHPTEIACTLGSCKYRDYENLWVVFQPHTYTRTKDLLKGFSESFNMADKIILLDIYSAREPYTNEIHSKDLEKLLKKKNKEVYYFSSFEDAEIYIRKNICQDDILITMGAGDVYKLGESLIL
ncbi:MAG: UDP-N-acetylmuramate--L-alanine ligase [Lachnospirales bacterium]